MMDSTIFSDIYLNLDLVREILKYLDLDLDLDLVRETVSIFIIH
jgi:hypothetical protein